MSYQQILCEVDDAVATITLNRPTRMNALTKIMEAELRSAIEAAGRDLNVRAIVLVHLAESGDSVWPVWRTESHLPQLSPKRTLSVFGHRRESSRDASRSFRP
jgi:hypothetical protein